eukprot:866040-Prorocentrum_minimum.AAC.1
MQKAGIVSSSQVNVNLCDEKDNELGASSTRFAPAAHRSHSRCPRHDGSAQSPKSDPPRVRVLGRDICELRTRSDRGTVMAAPADGRSVDA